MLSLSAVPGDEFAVSMKCCPRLISSVEAAVSACRQDLKGLSRLPVSKNPLGKDLSQVTVLVSSGAREWFEGVIEGEQ